MTIHLCLNGPTPADARTRHAWSSAGLDVVDARTGRQSDDTDAVLAHVRRCVWCKAEQHRPYGGRHWRAVR